MLRLFAAASAARYTAITNTSANSLIKSFTSLHLSQHPTYTPTRAFSESATEPQIVDTPDAAQSSTPSIQRTSQRRTATASSASSSNLSPVAAEKAKIEQRMIKHLALVAADKKKLERLKARAAKTSQAEKDKKRRQTLKLRAAKTSQAAKNKALLLRTRATKQRQRDQLVKQQQLRRARMQRERIAANKAKMNAPEMKARQQQSLQRLLRAGRPRRPLSAYLLFVQSKLKGVRSSLTDQGNVVKQLAEQWKSMSDAEKDEYQTKSKQHAEAYQQQMQAYAQTAVVKPKRVASAYNLFIHDNASKFPQGTTFQTGATIIQQLSEQWRQMSDTEKSSYQDRLQALKQTYQEQLDKYNRYVQDLTEQARVTKSANRRRSNAPIADAPRQISNEPPTQQ